MSKKTHISFVVEKCHFMESHRENIIKSINNQIELIKPAKNDLFFSLAFFGERAEKPLILNKPKKDLKKIRKTHYCLENKLTNLRTDEEYCLSSVCDAIGETCLRLLGLPDEENQDEFVVIIFYYGEENNSTMFPPRLISNLLKTLPREKWKFKFIRFNPNNKEFEDSKVVSILDCENLSKTLSKTIKSLSG